MNRTMYITFWDHDALTLTLEEHEIGAPNTRDCFQLARAILHDMGYAGKTAKASLFDAGHLLARRTLLVP